MKIGKNFKIVDGDISDGYHTFDELYEHRVLLFMALVITMSDKSAFKRDFETWSCLYLELPTGQISYHIPNTKLCLIEDIVKEDSNYVWDGHTSKDVEKRLYEFLRMREWNPHTPKRGDTDE